MSINSSLPVRNSIIIFLIHFFSLLSLQGQPGIKGVISGRVFDNSTKQPLEYATVVLINRATGKTVNGTIADARGNFTIQNIPWGNYRIDIDFIGYEKISFDNISINPLSSSVSIGQMYLNPTTQSLQGVVVTANKSVVENKIDKIVYNASADITSQGGLAIDVLKKVPQVTVDIDGNVELQGNSNIRFLINGKPSSVFGNNIADALASIPASQIKSIEAITNPGSKYDSQGTGGIINIILKDNKMEGVNSNINLSAGSRLENGSANLNIRHNNFGVNAFFSGQALIASKSPFSNSRISYDSTLKQSATLNQNGESDFIRNGYRSGLGFDWSITKNDNITGSIGFNQFYTRGSGKTRQEQTVSDYSGAMLSDMMTLRNSDSWSRFRSLDWNLEFKKKFRREGQELDMLYNSTDGTPASWYSLTQTYNGQSLPYMGSSSRNPGTDRETDISIDYAQPVSETFTLETGVKSTFHNIHSIVEASRYSTINDQFLPDSIQSYDMRYNMNIYAGYISGNLKLFSRFDLKTGLRYEHTSVIIDFPNTIVPSYGTIVPSTVLSYNLSKTSSLKISYSRRIERPDYRALNPFLNLSDPYNINTGNPALKPETGNNFELGYSTTFKKGGSLYLSLIERINSRDIKQITRFYPTYQIGDSVYKNVSVSAPLNNGFEYNTGISASGSYPVTKKLNIRGNLMIFHRYIVSNITGDMSMGLRTRANLNLSWQLPRDLVIEMFGFYNAASKNVQGRIPQFFIYTFAFRKLFLNKNASFGLTATNFLSKYVRQETTISTGNSTAKNIRELPLRSFGISFSYKFGRLEFNKNNKEEDQNNFLNNQSSR